MRGPSSVIHSHVLVYLVLASTPLACILRKSHLTARIVASCSYAQLYALAYTAAQLHTKRHRLSNVSPLPVPSTEVGCDAIGPHSGCYTCRGTGLDVAGVDCRCLAGIGLLTS